MRQKYPPEVLLKKAVLKSFAIFTKKHLCSSNRLWPATLLKKRLQHRGFPLNILKFLRIPFLRNICERLLLNASKTYTMQSSERDNLLPAFFAEETICETQDEWVNILNLQSLCQNLCWLINHYPYKANKRFTANSLLHLSSDWRTVTVFL